MQIPTNPMYDIDENATVRLISTGAVIPEYVNRHGRRSVKIRGLSHKPSSHPLDRLMLNTFKPLPEGKDHRWYSIKFKDGNRDNLDIDNLEWDETWYTPPLLMGTSVPFDCWVTVIGYPDAQIKFSMEGIILRNTHTWKPIDLVNNLGYLVTKNKLHGLTVSLHRMIALTFLPHPIDTDHLTVNHKDSDKLNNHPNNLEWVTYSENNRHAYDEGGRQHSVRKIILKNITSGEETVVAGYNEMGRVMGVSPQAAHQAIERRKFEGRPYKGYIFKYYDDPRSWGEIAVSGPREDLSPTLPIACKDLSTGEIKIYNSPRDLFADHSMRPHTLRRLLKSKVIIPWRRKFFQEVVDNKPLKWPKYPEEVLEVFDLTHSSDRPILVIGNDGVYKYHRGVTDWCEKDRENRCDPAVLSRYMKNNKDQKLLWREWSFEYIDLSKFPLMS